MIRLHVALIAAVLCSPVSSQDGSLDATFSEDGILVLDLSDSTESFSAIAFQPDGKMIAAGNAFGPVDRDISLVRLLADGSLDPTFGTAGMVLTQASTGHDQAYAVALQADGKIVVAGFGKSGTGTTRDALLVRYNEDGSLDPGFGIGGIVLSTLGETGDQQFLYAMDVAPDGSIVTAGHGYDQLVCARFTSAGILDETFGSGGVVVPGVAPSGNGTCIRLLDDGSLLVGGSTYPNVGGQWALVKLTEDGIPDMTFGTDGIVTADLDTFIFEHMSKVDVLSDGRIVVCGHQHPGDYIAVPMVHMFLPDGTPDPAFGDNGRLLLPFGTDTTGTFTYVAVQPDDKILLVGSREHEVAADQGDVMLYRLLPGAEPDLGFGLGGRVFTDIGTSEDAAFGGSLAPDGTIALAGASISTEWNTLLLRYENDNTTGYSLAESHPAVRVSPNPMTDMTLIDLPANAGSPITLQLFNVHGQHVRSSFVGTSALYRMNRDALASGVYVLRPVSQDRVFPGIRLIVH